jgi:hypothetical protein
MKKIYLIILLFVAILSCTKLDVPLYDSIPESKFPEDPAQAALLMIPVYKPMANFLDGGGWWFAQELTSGECCILIPGTIKLRQLQICGLRFMAQFQ